jgi:hypothetical protein
MIQKKYGLEFWKKFQSESGKLFQEVLKKTPDIGESVFYLGYGDKCCNCHYELTGKCPIRPGGNLK